MADTTERPVIDAGLLERLRRRYTPGEPRCSVCGGEMECEDQAVVVGGAVSRVWYCCAAMAADEHTPEFDAHLSRGSAVSPIGDPDVVALLDTLPTLLAAAASASDLEQRIDGELPSLRLVQVRLEDAAAADESDGDEGEDWWGDTIAILRGSIASLASADVRRAVELARRALGEGEG